METPKSETMEGVAVRHKLREVPPEKEGSSSREVSLETSIFDVKLGTPAVPPKIFLHPKPVPLVRGVNPPQPKKMMRAVPPEILSSEHKPSYYMLPRRHGRDFSPTLCRREEPEEMMSGPPAVPPEKLPRPKAFLWEEPEEMISGAPAVPPEKEGSSSREVSPERFPSEEELEMMVGASSFHPEILSFEPKPPSDMPPRPDGRDLYGPHFDGRRIYCVPPQLMRMNGDSYAPSIVSFGPYNHGSPQVEVAEQFKLKVVDIFFSKTGNCRDQLFEEIIQVIGQIRSCYHGITEDVFRDEMLATIMLRDAIFLIYLMQKPMRENKLGIHKFLIEEYLGSAAIPFLYTDMLLLDNQIPLSIINLVISLIQPNKQEEQKEDGSSFVLRYFREGLLMGDNKIITSFPGKDGKEPLHFLDALWRLTAEEYSNGTQRTDDQPESSVVTGLKAKDRKQPLHLLNPCWRLKDQEVQLQVDHAVYRHINRPFHSVTDLKAKGVRFKPIDSHSQCVRHIKFNSWIICGKLQLPILSVDAGAKVMYSNLIAYEMSPGSNTQHVVTSYINFMKSLLITSKDVNELREKGIVFSTHDSDEHMIKQFKEIDTYGLDDPHIFYEVKKEIEKHCKRKVGTWMAELIYTYFRSPWSLISSLAAVVLLCLTATQTHYAVNPAS